MQLNWWNERILFFYSTDKSWGARIKSFFFFTYSVAQLLNYSVPKQSIFNNDPIYIRLQCCSNRHQMHTWKLFHRTSWYYFYQRKAMKTKYRFNAQTELKMWTEVKCQTQNLNDCYLLRWHKRSGLRRPFHKPVGHLPPPHLSAVSDSLSIRTASGCCGQPLWHMSFWRRHFIICQAMRPTAAESSPTPGRSLLQQCFKLFCFLAKTSQWEVWSPFIQMCFMGGCKYTSQFILAQFQEVTH